MEPKIETTVERLGNYYVAEIWIYWPDEPPQWKIVSKRSESALRRVIERVRWFVNTMSPAPTIDWFAENPIFVSEPPDPPTDPLFI